MTLSYEICKKLKDIGFPQKHPSKPVYYYGKKIKICCKTGFEDTDLLAEDRTAYIPTLKELVEFCGEETVDYPWGEEAVANLILKLKG